MPSLGWNQILSVAKTVDEAQINTWNDINRLDIRPNRGLIKIRSHNSIEIQIDSGSGHILHVAKRRSDLIESIHDATYFEKNANLWLMLPVASVAIIMAITGIILFFTPYFKRRSRRLRP